MREFLRDGLRERRKLAVENLSMYHCNPLTSAGENTSSLKVIVSFSPPVIFVVAFILYSFSVNCNYSKQSFGKTVPAYFHFYQVFPIALNTFVMRVIFEIIVLVDYSFIFLPPFLYFSHTNKLIINSHT